MPELPEVETVCRRLRKEARGAGITALRFARSQAAAPQQAEYVARHVAGTRLEGVLRRGKNILLQVSGGGVLRIHLRMTGNLYVIPDYRFRPATARAWFELADGRGIVFDDPRALGRIHWHRTEEMESVMREVGPEPLSRDFTPESLLAAARGSPKPAKIFLMDQRHVAGLGNIYAAEALFRAGIHPARPINRIRRARILALHTAIVSVLREAVRCAGLDAGSFPLAVYGRKGEPCDVCGRRVRRLPQGGRSTYFCPGCQR